MPKTFLMLVFAVGILLFLKEYFQNHRSRTKPNPSEQPSFPFVRQPALLSTAEGNLWRELIQAVGEENCVFCKVRLADVVRIRPELRRAEIKRAHEPIAAMSLDFVICRRSNLSIAAAVQLTGDGVGMDAESKNAPCVEGPLAAAGVPLLRLCRDQEYTAGALRSELRRAATASTDAIKRPATGTDPRPNSAQRAPLAASMPEACPACGAQMVRRRVSGGRMDGNHVLACPKYPSCKHVLPLTIQTALPG